MEVLAHHGTAAQKERFLKPLVRGEIRSCFGMTEPEYAGSNPAWLGTRARREGDTYVLDGHKWFTSGADGASFCIVMAVTDPDASSPYLRASQIIVPMDTPGFKRMRNIPVAGEAGEGWASHSEVVLGNVRVPVDNRLGQEGMGLDWKMATIGDPLSDLGMALAYWAEAKEPQERVAFPFELTMLPGNLTREEVVARYAEKSGRDVSGIAFHYVLSLFKVSVIA